jgi:hypothetical protein
MSLSISAADTSTIRLFDGVLLAWLALWLVVGGWTGVVLWQLADLGDTVSSSGGAIASAGEALESLDQVPVVGDRPAELGREAQTTGADIRARGQEVKGQLRQLSILIGLAVALIPTTPVLGLYLPLRVARRREVRALARSLRQHGDDPELDRFLAERALRSLPHHVVHRLVDDPVTAIAEGRARPLADAELDRLGLSRRSGRRDA